MCDILLWILGAYVFVYALIGIWYVFVFFCFCLINLRELFVNLFKRH